jgi:hypothetical protein
VKHRTDWSLSALLVVQAVSLFVAAPLGGQVPAAHLLLDLCRLFYALICIASLTNHRLLQGWLLAALVLLSAGPFAGHGLFAHLGWQTGRDLQHSVLEIAAFCFNMVVTMLVARRVFGPGRINAHRVRGAVLLYLNIAAQFAIAYNVVLWHWPGAIVSTSGHALPLGPADRNAALTYFSFATLTTTGFGDLVPVHPLARSLSNLEAVIGQLFPATLLARIVALHIEHDREDQA